MKTGCAKCITKTLYLQVQTRRQSSDWIHHSTHYATEGGQLKEAEVEKDTVDCACTEEPHSTWSPAIKIETLGLRDQRATEAGCEGLQCCRKKLRPIIGGGGIGEEVFSIYPHLSTVISNLIFNQCQRPHTDH